MRNRIHGVSQRLSRVGFLSRRVSNPRAPMDAAPQKRARIRELVAKLPCISQAALVAICRVASAEPLPAITDQKEVRQARDEVAKHGTPYGVLHAKLPIERVDGGYNHMSVQCPLPMLWYLCKHNNAFSEMVKRCAATQPPTRARPWKLILYLDEVSPRNQLACKSNKKCKPHIGRY